MAAVRNRPFEQFGPYVLFKKLESDALTDLWRAGRIEGNAIGAPVALRRFHAGHREALVSAARAAQPAAAALSGSSFVKAQTIDVIENTPFVTHEYAGGRSLQHIVERARGGAGITPHPIPIDLAVNIAEKVALSVATMTELRYSGERMMHGALLPQFVWISDDGEIRVAGQMLGPGIIASLRDAKVGAQAGRYFSPEYQSSGTPSQASEVYALGAILYLVVTGHEPPDPVSGSAFTQTIRSAKTMEGTAIPADIRAIIEKSLVLDPKARYATVSDLKQALSALVHGGTYPATTFNLAFYLSNLLKKEIEGEAVDREKETKVNVAAFAPAVPPVTPPPTFESTQKPSRRFPLAAAAAVAVLAVLGGGAYVMFGSKPPVEAKPMAVAKVAAPAPQPVSKPAPVIPEPIVVQSTTAPVTPPPQTATADAEAARKKAFEDAVKQRMNQEMMKLQAQYTRELQQRQSKNAPVQTASLTPPTQSSIAPAMQEEKPSISAAQLDQQRMASRQEVVPAPAVQETAAPVQQQPASQPIVATIQEGDIIDITEVDVAPRPLSEIRPTPSPIAVRQHVQGSSILTVFVSESGSVLDAKVLSGVGKFGVDDAALRAVKNARFSPATKNGKRVKTWMPLRIDFKL